VDTSALRGLIVHADDFGETEQITLGICQGIDAGVVTSASIMANMPATDFGITRAKDLESRASFGVHLNLCEGRPLTPAPSMVDGSGNFCSKRQLFLRSVTGRLAAKDVEQEIAAQVQHIIDAGVRVSHLDGHKHLHQLPVVCNAVARVARHHNIDRVRLAAMRSAQGYASPSSAMREVLSVNAARVFRNAKLRYPRRLIDISVCMTAMDRLPAWRQLLGAEGIVEVFCHPGTTLADAEKPGSCNRSEELEFLLSSRMRQLINASEVQLVNYWSV
jgi:chitin disaccharide deacetylase